MNGSKGYRASDASEKSVENLPILSLTTVQKMLPLVQRILDDYLRSQKAVEALQPEEARLDRSLTRPPMTAGPPPWGGGPSLGIVHPTA